MPPSNPSNPTDPTIMPPTSTSQPASASQPPSQPASSSTQKPTPGRIVHFKNGDQIEAAMIVGVHSDTVATLKVWNAGGVERTEASAEYGPGPGQWSWPPRI